MGLGLSRFGGLGGSSSGTITGLTNPLVSDLDGGSSYGLKNIDSLLFDSNAATKAGWKLDLWVGFWTDGKNGSGFSMTDSIDVSTADLMDTFMKTNAYLLLGGCHVHFGPGTFSVWGAPQAYSSVTKGFNLPGGNWYQGSGMGITTLQLHALSDSGQMGVLRTNVGVDNKNTRVSDMTCDANWPALKGGSPPTTSNVTGIEINGTSGVEIDHVQFLNNYGNFVNGQECFITKITSPNISGNSLTCEGNIVHDCYWDKFQGDYGGCVVIWNFLQGANNLTDPSFNAICNNVMANHNHLQLTGATGGTVYAIGEMIGQGCLIFGNRTYNCTIGCYSEGQSGATMIIGNQFYNCVLGGINQNGTANALVDSFFENNYVEVSTAILGPNYNNNNKFGINAGMPTNATGFRVKNNTVVRRQVGYTTATRSRNGSNVATITFSSAPGGVGFNNGDLVDTTLFGGTGYNVGYVQLTRNSSTSYSYACPGSLETTQTDTTGTVTLVTTGIVVNSQTNQTGNIEVSGNRVDHTLYNQFNYNNNAIFTLWRDNLTETGAPLTLLPGIQHGLPSEVRWSATNNPTTNGTNLVAAYAHAKLIDPNGAAASATNRVALILPIGNYTLTAGNATGTVAGQLLADTNFIDFIGQASRDNTILTSSAQTFTTGSSLTDIRLRNFTITTTDSSTKSNSSSVAAFWNLGTPNASWTFEDMKFNGAGVQNGHRGGQQWSGTMRRCDFACGGFAGDIQGQINAGAVVDNCTVGANGMSNAYNVGLIQNCNLTIQLNLYRNDGVIQYCVIKTSATNADAILESNNGANGGITRSCTLISNGTGTAYKNSGGSRTTSIGSCFLRTTKDSSITNTLGTDAAAFNTVNTAITQ